MILTSVHGTWIIKVMLKMLNPKFVTLKVIVAITPLPHAGLAGASEHAANHTKPLVSFISFFAMKVGSYRKCPRVTLITFKTEVS